MTTDVHIDRSRSASALEPLGAKSGWIIALGAIYVIVGLIALGSVLMATAAGVLVVGIMMVIAGVAEVVNAFQIKTWGSFFLWLLLGALYIVAGFVTSQNPLLAAAVLTLMLGAALGLIILTRWPISSLYVIGLFLGIDLVFAGAGWIGVGLGLKQRT